jgi:pyridoxine/pyridoxamine 5'-phosphate oxidase
LKNNLKKVDKKFDLLEGLILSLILFNNLKSLKMTKQEIKEAINNGLTVYWQNLAYEVIIKGDDLYTFCTFNRSVQYLEQFNEEDFFTT